MKIYFGVILSIMLLLGSVALHAADNKLDADKAPDKTGSAAKDAPVSPQDRARQLVMNNLQAMQSKEMGLVVLQQLMNREVGELRQMQAVFCDQNKLDVEKWRKGLYRYDDKTVKFEETAEPPKANN